MRAAPLESLACLEAQARTIEAEIVLSAEEAAERGCPKGQLPAHQADWDRATWGRYIAEARRMNDLIGGVLSRIYRDIDRLKRLEDFSEVA